MESSNASSQSTLSDDLPSPEVPVGAGVSPAGSLPTATRIAAESSYRPPVPLPPETREERRRRIVRNIIAYFVMAVITLVVAWFCGSQ